LSNVNRRLDDWKARLIDLSRRNNLLYFRVGGNTLRVEEPGASEVFQRLYLDESSWEVWEPPDKRENADQEGGHHEDQDEPDPEPSPPPLRSGQIRVTSKGRRDWRKVLSATRQRARSFYEETGLQILHVGVGTLAWKDEESGDEVVSPLLLLPVELRRESRRSPYQLLPTDEPLILNPALSLKLSRDFNVVLPDLPEDWESNALSAYLLQVQEIADDKGWQVQDDCYLSLFSFLKLVIHKDLGGNEEKICDHPVIRAMAGDWNQGVLHGGVLDVEKLRGGGLDSMIPPKEECLVLDADSSQMAAIKSVREGRSLVIQGPPGTGKSQTIANILAAMIAAGKKVLFVSEKMAALEVVKKRLTEVHLDRYCLELHSHKSKRAEVVGELWKSCTEALHPGALMTDHEYARLTRRRDALNQYVRELHHQHIPPGWSVFEALGKLSRLNDVELVRWTPPEEFNFSPANLETVEDLSGRMSQVWDLVREEDFPWRGCKDTTYSPAIRDQWKHLLSDLRMACDRLRVLSQRLAEDECCIPGPLSLKDVSWLVELARLLQKSPGPPRHWLGDASIRDVMEDTRHWQELASRHGMIRKRLETRFRAEFFDIPPDLHAGMERSAKDILSLLQKPADKVTAQSQPLRKFLEDTLQKIPVWARAAGEMSEALGFRSKDPGLAELQRLGRIMELTNGPDAPPSGWVDRARWPEAEAALLSLESSYDNHEDLKKSVLRDYDESALSIDIKGLIERFSGPYGNVLKWLRPSYYRDRATLRSLRHDGIVPPDALHDLKKIRSFLRIRLDVETLRGSLCSVFGELDQGPGNTDFGGLRRKLSIARDIADLLSDPEESASVQAYLAAGKISRERYGAALSLLRVIQANQALMEAVMTVLPEGVLPGHDQNWMEVPLGELATHARQVADALAVVSGGLARIEEMRNEAVRNGSTLSLKDAFDVLGDLNTVRNMEEELKRESARLSEIYGSFFKGFDSPWEVILAALAWTDSLRKHFQDSPLPERLIDVALRTPPQFPALEACEAALSKLKSLLEGLNAQFEGPEWSQEDLSPDSASFATIESIGVKLDSRVEQLREWVASRKFSDEFREKGLGDLLHALGKLIVRGESLVRVVRKAVIQGWCETVFRMSPALANFRGDSHDALIGEYQELDKRLRCLSPHHIIKQAETHRPPMDYVEPDGELAVLRRQVHLQRRHLPVRKLLERIPNLLPRIKPIVMMSPISVSYFLPSTVKFDLVVFDEASQVLPEDAIGAIYRGTQVVVCGDAKQLPPTDFFRSAAWEDDDVEIPEDEIAGSFQSILDELGAAGIPLVMLRWHYRSRHESLIAFSNARFYDWKLVTYPSSVQRDPSLGIRLEHVPHGIYDRGRTRTNRQEADRVAELIHEHFITNPDKTLGVVAFSEAQRDAIAQALELRMDQFPELERYVAGEGDRLSGFFMKNLENVQGDERDSMIFSVGYGKDANGVMTMGFGPLNREGGERRLNVAITRAREKVILVSSILARDIDIQATRMQGPILLRAYLDYAERGEEALSLPPEISGGDAESPFEEDVSSALRSLGYDIVPQVGCNRYRIDIGVVDPDYPGRFALGVECDGATYHSAASARDRDRLRQEVLEKLGWTIHRVWSPDWIMARQKEIEKLREAVQGGIERLRTREQKRAEIKTPTPNVIDIGGVLEDNGQDSLPPEVELYVVAAFRSSPLRVSEFHAPENRSKLLEYLERLVRFEGPIHRELAGRRLIEAYDINRMGSRVDEAVRDAIQEGVSTRRFREDDGFLCPPEMTRVEKVRAPNPGDPRSKRKIEHISIDEIHQAIVLVLGRAHSMNKEKMKSRLADIFGFSRTGNHISERIELALQFGIEEGFITLEGDLVQLTLEKI
jgi:very-short-patch-repair endonuclease